MNEIFIIVCLPNQFYNLCHTLLWSCRLAVEAWGLKNCTQKEEWFSDTVTAIVVPSYIDSAEIVRRAWKRYNLSLGLGLNKVAGKVFRIGHLGNLNEVCVIFCVLYKRNRKKPYLIC